MTAQLWGAAARMRFALVHKSSVLLATSTRAVRKPALQALFTLPSGWHAFCLYTRLNTSRRTN